MAIEINNLVINYLEKHADGEVTLRNRDDVVPVTERVSMFMEQLHFAYNSKPAKGYCAFSPDKSDSFASHLNGLIANEQPFVSFAASASDLLCDELKKYPFEENGYLLLCHYNYLATEYLLILQLAIKEHFSVTQELDISASRHLDLSTMQLAARIDMTEYQVNPESNRYVTFIKGRAGRKVADFFLDFMGCEEGIDAKQQSKVMLDAVEEFIATESMDHEEKVTLRKEVFDYCNEKVQMGEDAKVTELNDMLQGDDKTPSFESFYQEQGYELEDSFPVDKKTVSTLVKFSGQGGGVSVGFEKKHLGERVLYDPVTDTLTIKGVPPNLKDQLTRYLTGNKG